MRTRPKSSAKRWRTPGMPSADRLSWPTEWPCRSGRRYLPGIVVLVVFALGTFVADLGFVAIGANGGLKYGRPAHRRVLHAWRLLHLLHPSPQASPVHGHPVRPAGNASAVLTGRLHLPSRTDELFRLDLRASHRRLRAKRDHRGGGGLRRARRGDRDICCGRLVGPGAAGSADALPRGDRAAWVDVLIVPAMGGVRWCQGCLYALLKHYVEHPEARVELGTDAVLARLGR
ncbi:hypothetical protein [Kibdelosporangium philippinense]|uniref:hypothetical protein n=1 Tax=Kibdelosporangium philippinense TaxID=211113 RepID=UPI00360ECDB5